MGVLENKDANAPQSGQWHGTCNVTDMGGVMDAKWVPWNKQQSAVLEHGGVLGPDGVLHQGGNLDQRGEITNNMFATWEAPKGGVARPTSCAILGTREIAESVAPWANVGWG